MLIKEKKHRLPEIAYKGEVSVAFTLCVQDRQNIFLNSSIVDNFTIILKSLMDRHCCIIPVYCFMPDHQHLIVTGASEQADSLKFIKMYKQKTGYWLSKSFSAKWQKDFYDHVIRKEENLINISRYILDNPVRKGLVAHWRDYPFKGSIGCDLEDLLASMT
jgi:REP element-mobilizing transposase RayT